MWSDWPSKVKRNPSVERFKELHSNLLVKFSTHFNVTLWIRNLKFRKTTRLSGVLTVTSSRGSKYSSRRSFKRFASCNVGGKTIRRCFFVRAKEERRWLRRRCRVIVRWLRGSWSSCKRRITSSCRKTGSDDWRRRNSRARRRSASKGRKSSSDVCHAIVTRTSWCRCWKTSADFSNFVSCSTSPARRGDTLSRSSKIQKSPDAHAKYWVGIAFCLHGVFPLLFCVLFF